jgi:hypothetical protein
VSHLGLLSYFLSGVSSRSIILSSLILAECFYLKLLFRLALIELILFCNEHEERLKYAESSVAN